MTASHDFDIGLDVPAKPSDAPPFHVGVCVNGPWHGSTLKRPSLTPLPYRHGPFSGWYVWDVAYNPPRWVWHAD